MPDEQSAAPVSLADSASAYSKADADVQALERERADLAAKLVAMDEKIATAKQGRDKAHASLRGAL